MQVFLLEFGSNSQPFLSPEETQHCMKVLRHRVGDEIFAIDGKGSGYHARISSLVNKEAQLDILETLPQWGEPGPDIHLFASPLRLKDRFEWMVEKSVELGVTHFHPVSCARTEPYRSKYKEPRIRTLMRTATKQTKRGLIPALLQQQSFEEAIQVQQAPLRILAYCEATTPIQDLQPRLAGLPSVELWIGPEGDFTSEEAAAAEAAGFELVSLGSQRLRTETAALFGLSWLKTCWGY